MKLQEILKSYKRTDLNRLAKDKLAGYMGWPVDVLRDELCRSLPSYERVKRSTEFRKPPGYIILKIMVEQEGYNVPIQNLKALVREEVNKIIDIAKRGKGLKKDKQYDLFTLMLKTAWSFQDDMSPAEANLLATLREHLGITMDEQRILEASPELNVFRYSEETFNREIDHYVSGGIILTHEANYVLAEEVAERIKEVWGIELDTSDYTRLLEYFTNSQLSTALGNLKLVKGGTQKAKIDRILNEEVRPSVLLNVLSVGGLNTIAKKCQCPRGGKKEEFVAVIINHIKRKADIVSEEEPLHPPPEPREIADDTYKMALSEFNIDQLYRALSNKDLKRSGTKDQKIETIVNSRYNFKTTLNTLTVGDLSALCKAYKIHPHGRKEELITRIIEHFKLYRGKGSKATPEKLLTIYDELSQQKTSAYRDIGIDDKKITIGTIASDFERATKYIFESIFKLTVKSQTPGKEEPDGVIEGDKIILYDCKTVLAPPYELPISHRDQFRRYVKEGYDKLEPHAKTALQGFIIISHSFTEKIEDKLNDIKPDPSISRCVISAGDLKFIAEKWRDEQEGRTLPCSKLVFQGCYTRDKLKARFV